MGLQKESVEGRASGQTLMPNLLREFGPWNTEMLSRASQDPCHACRMRRSLWCLRRRRQRTPMRRPGRPAARRPSCALASCVASPTAWSPARSRAAPRRRRPWPAPACCARRATSSPSAPSTWTWARSMCRQTVRVESLTLDC